MKPRLSSVLKEVNAVRKILGAKPLSKMPKGKVGKSTKCPIHNALPAPCKQVGTNLKFLHNLAGEEAANKLRERWACDNSYRFGIYEVRMPPILRSFVFAFDSGDYPTLIEG